MTRIDGSDEPTRVPFPLPTRFVRSAVDARADATNFEFGRVVETQAHGVNNAAMELPLFGRAELLGVRGYLLCLTGRGPNLAFRRSRYLDASTTTVAPRAFSLQIRAPECELAPAQFTPPGLGHVFGNEFRWYYRYKNKETGEVSGLSPATTEVYNVGVQMGDTEDYYGQDIKLAVPGVDRDETLISTIEWFRNTSEGTVLYLLGETPNPGVGTDAEFDDVFPDEDLIAAGVTSDLLPNPRFNEAVMTPMAKAYFHPNGRVAYYGTIKTTNLEGTCTLTADSNLVTASTANIPPHREGQKFVLPWVSGTEDDAPDFLVVEADVTTPSQFKISGEVGAALDLFGGSATATTIPFVIEDNRDARSLHWSRPGLPTQIDVLETVLIGLDADEKLLHVFGWLGGTFALSGRRIYLITDDDTEEPSLTLRVQVVAEEGTFGLWSSAETPFGPVFFNEHGVRHFDGQVVRPLGSESSFSEFLARYYSDQVSPTSLADSLLFYDKDNHLVHLTVVSPERSFPDRSLVFDPEAGVWRGWWRRRVYSDGEFLTSAGNPRFVFGDDLGNVYHDQQQTLDHVPIADDLTAFALDGRIASISGSVLTTAAGDVLHDTEKTLVGAPILYETAVRDAWEQNWIADVVANGSVSDVTLLHASSGTVKVNGQYLVGWVEWQATTTEIDSGEPVRPETANSLHLRFQRETDEDPVEVWLSVDEKDYERSQGTENESCQPDASFWDLNLQGKRGRTFSLRLRGRSKTGAPEITQARLEMNLRAGGNRT